VISAIRKEENPRERMLKHGSENLTDTELVALVLRSGGRDKSVLVLARELLKNFGGLKGLIDTEVQELIQYTHMGLAKATGLKAISELALRLNYPQKERPKIDSPKDVIGAIKKDLFGKKKEHLYVLATNAKNELLAKYLISIGSSNEALIHPRDVFRKAIKANAYSIVLVHNHPSGKTKPSKEDIAVTHRIAETGRTVGIPLLDHLIVADSEFTSMKQKNLL
jgi:DNA repair protein RadC